MNNKVNEIKKSNLLKIKIKLSDKIKINENKRIKAYLRNFP